MNNICSRLMSELVFDVFYVFVYSIYRDFDRHNVFIGYLIARWNIQFLCVLYTQEYSRILWQMIFNYIIFSFVL